MTTLRELCRAGLRAVLEDKSRKVYVMGNTSCDLDSLCSSIGLACLENVLGSLRTDSKAGSNGNSTVTNISTLYVPVVNFERKHFCTLLQQSFWLKSYFGIVPEEDLVFLEDIIAQGKLQAHDSFFLVDHNSVDSRQTAMLAKRVIGCLDHHELSESFHSDILAGKDKAAIVAHVGVEDSLSGLIEICAPSGPKLVGSTCSIVLDHMTSGVKASPRVSDIQDGSCPERKSLLELQFLLSGGILADTANFSDRTKDVKWSSFDVNTLAAAWSHGPLAFVATDEGVPDFSMDNERSAIFEKLGAVKFDVQQNLQMGVGNLLGTDYKRFEYEYNTKSQSGTKPVAFGYATLTVQIGALLSHLGNDPAKILGEFATFAKERDVEFLIFLTITKTGEREFGFFMAEPSREEAAKIFQLILEKAEKPMELQPLDVKECAEGNQKFCAFQQGNKSMSRKQVDPLISTIVNSG